MSELLLDTHVFCWIAIEPERIGPKTWRLLKNEANTIAISAYTTLEIAQLCFKNRLSLKMPHHEWVSKMVRNIKAESISMDDEIASMAYSLRSDFHGDPADRVIVSTAIINGLDLITADERILTSQLKECKRIDARR